MIYLPLDDTLVRQLGALRDLQRIEAGRAYQGGDMSGVDDTINPILGAA